MDFIAIGDTAVDEFIRLKDASVHCDINNEDCTISMRWGDKIPYDFSVLVPGVGNAANAAVAAARLGLNSGFISNIGDDDYGKKTLESFKKNNVDAAYVAVNADIPTNHHYVLWFESERTILIRHEDYPYVIPQNFVAPKWLYLSSAGASSAEFHLALAQWLAEHPETKLAFQPGTFQISMGKEKLAELYKHTELVACNKEEAEKILGFPVDTDIETLVTAFHSIGPKLVVITDGRRGAHASDGEHRYFVPLYPDPRPPFERTGAGDAFTSTVAAMIALGKTLPEALLYAPINSMSVVQKIGAQEGLLTRAEIEDWLAKAPTEYKLTAV